jgi:aspartate-semialdehyde dehydrogenase
MNQKKRIYVAGYAGLVGSALMRRLEVDGYNFAIQLNVIDAAHRYGLKAAVHGELVCIRTCAQR